MRNKSACTKNERVSGRAKYRIRKYRGSIIGPSSTV